MTRKRVDELVVGDRPAWNTMRLFNTPGPQYVTVVERNDDVLTLEWDGRQFRARDRGDKVVAVL